jgi:ribulose-5-phosphate 4-epimerase/fuculose-1-phosphate aldolase
MPTTNDREKRQSIIDACLRMSQLGINQGTSGNISLRHDEGMLITPTSVPYETMQPEQIVFMGLDGSFDSRQRPSSEWRFHLDILKARPEVNAVVHAHPFRRSTTWSPLRAAIPSGARRTRPTAPSNSRNTPSAPSKTGSPVFWHIMA